MVRRIVAGAALAALCASQAIAQAGCLERADAETLMTALLPAVIGNLAEHCTPHLSAAAPLIADSGGLVARVGPAADAARPAASQIAANLLAESSDGDLPPELQQGIGEQFGLNMFEYGIQSAVAGAMDANSCRTVDRFVETLSPLPPENLASLVVLLMEMGQRDDVSGASPFRVCTTG